MKSKIILILSIFFGLMMVNSGLNKIFNYMPMPKMPEEVMTIMGAYMTIKWIFPLVALIEIIGGVLVAIPKTRAFGAVFIFPLMVGIIVHHLTHDVAGIGFGLILFLINVWVIIENKDRYLPIIK